MIINHNLPGANAIRQMNTNSATASKSMQKLSSGLRINSAADDAAGLAISEKMRGQIRGLDQGSANAQDGISMIQTAEGALSETESILQRMRELSVQSSNDTNNADDRTAIQKEVAQLNEEIDRIGNTTEFNTTKLIDGSIGASKVAGTDNAAVIGTSVGSQTSAKAVGDVYTKGTNALDTLTDDNNTITVDGAKIDFKLSTDQISAYKAAANDQTKLGELITKDINSAIDTYNSTNGTNVGKISAEFDISNKLNVTSGTTGATSTIGGEKQGAATGLFSLVKFGDNNTQVATVTGSEGVYSAAGAGAINSVTTTDTSNISVDGTDLKVTWTNTGNPSVTGGTTDMSALSDKIATDINKAISDYNNTVPSDKKLDSVSVNVKDGSFVVQSGSSKSTSSIKFDNSSAATALGLSGQSSAVQGGGVDFQIGANQGQTMKVTIADMRSAALGIDKVDMSTKDGAQTATTLLDNAIKSVSSQRADLGAYQNRLEHTINNLGTSSENLTSAESRIRDVDMAKEMSTFSKNNILSQAAQAMLAQANTQPQQVLQLLR